jgi:hypothetical protein
MVGVEAGLLNGNLMAASNVGHAAEIAAVEEEQDSDQQEYDKHSEPDAWAAKGKLFRGDVGDFFAGHGSIVARLIEFRAAAEE